MRIALEMCLLPHLAQFLSIDWHHPYEYEYGVVYMHRSREYTQNKGIQDLNWGPQSPQPHFPPPSRTLQPLLVLGRLRGVLGDRGERNTLVKAQPLADLLAFVLAVCSSVIQANKAITPSAPLRRTI